MLKNLADLVGPDDDLWILGDFAFGRKAKDASFLSEIFEQLPGARNHLIAGNHDFQPTLELGWDTVTAFMELRDGPQNQLNTLCHYGPSATRMGTSHRTSCGTFCTRVRDPDR